MTQGEVMTSAAAGKTGTAGGTAGASGPAGGTVIRREDGPLLHGEWAEIVDLVVPGIASLPAREAPGVRAPGGVAARTIGTQRGRIPGAGTSHGQVLAFSSPAGPAGDAPAGTATDARRLADGTGLTVTLLEDRPGLRLRGEADLLSADALREAVAALAAGPREVHFELAGLAFIDVAGTRELLALARRPPRPRLVLHQPPPSLIRLIRLLGPDCRQLSVPAGSRRRNRPVVIIEAA
jgi:anti-anti-sigma regulatory factor